MPSTQQDAPTRVRSRNLTHRHTPGSLRARIRSFLWSVSQSWPPDLNLAYGFELTG